MSLEEDGEDVDDSVALLPVPSKDEYVEVAVLLGPRAASMFSNTASLERALSANAARLTLSSGPSSSLSASSPVRVMTLITIGGTWVSFNGFDGVCLDQFKCRHGAGFLTPADRDLLIHDALHCGLRVRASRQASLGVARVTRLEPAM